MLRHLAPLAVAGILLAGCVSHGPGPSGTPTTAPAGALPAPGNQTNGLEPLLLPVQAGPDAPLTAFRWTIPAAAFVMAEGTQPPQDEVRLSIVPLLPDGLVLQEHAVLVFSLGREVGLLAGSISVPQTGFIGNGLSTTPQEVAAIPLQPQVLHIPANGLQEDDALGIVVAARSEAAASFEILFSGDPDAHADRMALSDGEPIQAVASGSGDGFQFASFVHIDLIDPSTGPLVLEQRSAGVQVDDGLPQAPSRPAASVEDRTVTARFEQAGFAQSSVVSLASALVAGACPWAGTYDVAIDLHGNLLDQRNVLAGSGAAILVTGLPFATVVGDGQGPAVTRIELRQAYVCPVAFTELQQLALGATLRDLFGTDATPVATSFAGLTGNVPPQAPPT